MLYDCSKTRSKLDQEDVTDYVHYEDVSLFPMLDCRSVYTQSVCILHRLCAGLIDTGIWWRLVVIHTSYTGGNTLSIKLFTSWISCNEKKIDFQFFNDISNSIHNKFLKVLYTCILYVYLPHHMNCEPCLGRTWTRVCCWKTWLACWWGHQSWRVLEGLPDHGTVAWGSPG